LPGGSRGLGDVYKRQNYNSKKRLKVLALITITSLSIARHHLVYLPSTHLLHQRNC
jgi:hypothetical protein